MTQLQVEVTYRVFSLTWPASMQIYWNKRSVCIRKEFNSQRIGLGHQHGRRFIVLGHQYGRRDVMWKHSIATRPQVGTCNKSSISPLQREKPKIYSPFFLLGKPAFCSVVIKRNKPTKERNLETRNILSHRWKSFHARLKRKTTWSRVVAAFYIGFCCAIALVDWKACAYYICHAGIFLHVMNRLIVYLFIYFSHFWRKMSSHNFGKKTWVFTSHFNFWNFTRTHTHRQKFSHTIHWSVKQRTELAHETIKLNRRKCDSLRARSLWSPRRACSIAG